jgi:two-component system invasion response regulator UvrY
MVVRKTTVVLVDDHILLRNGLATLIRSFGDFTVLFEADNGKQFMEQLKSEILPDIVLLDINMPEMDGYETALWLKRNHPTVKILALSMYDNDNAIIRMIKNGAKGYILKDIEPGELKTALNALVRRGFYYSEMITGKLIHTVNNLDEHEQSIKSLTALNGREIEFLKLVCTEKTYKEIADDLFISPRTVDGYRDDLFEKLHVKTRIGLAMYALKNGIVDLSNV